MYLTSNGNWVVAFTRGFWLGFGFLICGLLRTFSSCDDRHGCVERRGGGGPPSSRDSVARCPFRPFCAANELEAAVSNLAHLRRWALPEAVFAGSRRGRVDPAWQRVCLAKRSQERCSAVEAGLEDTLSWLRKKSGAVSRRAARGSKRLGESRADLEKAVLQKRRTALMELVVEAKLPIWRQAELASLAEPDVAVALSLGSLRAATMAQYLR